MGSQVVHNDQMTGLEARGQHLLHEGEKNITIGGRFNAHAGEHALHSQSCQHRQCAPVASRNRFPDSFRARRPAIAARHLRRHAALIQKDQAGGVYLRDQGWRETPQSEQMPRAYSDDLRRKLLEAYAAGRGSLRELASQFGVSWGYSKKIRAQQLQTGGMERPGQLRHGPKGRLTAELEQHLRAAVRRRPDVTLTELQQQLGEIYKVQVSRSRLWYWLRGLGLRHKKNRSGRRNRTRGKPSGSGRGGGNWSRR